MYRCCPTLDREMTFWIRNSLFNMTVDNFFIWLASQDIPYRIKRKIHCRPNAAITHVKNEVKLTLTMFIIM